LGGRVTTVDCAVKPGSVDKPVSHQLQFDADSVKWSVSLVAIGGATICVTQVVKSKPDEMMPVAVDRPSAGDHTPDVCVVFGLDSLTSEALSASLAMA
jgi:hypothetical protein